MGPRLFQKRFRATLCGGLLLFSVLLRLVCSPEQVQRLTGFLEGPELLRAAFYLQTGIRLPEAAETAQPTEGQALSTEPTVPDTTGEPVDFSLAFTPAEADRIRLRGSCTYAVDKTGLLLAPLTWHTAEAGPQVLIVHTHTTEAYAPSPGYEYEASGDYRTLDSSRNVTAVGAALAKALEKEGVSVIYSDTVHDSPDYNSAYYNAKETIEWYLARYPSIVMVLDVHRDAAETPFTEVTEIGGETAAKIMLLTGTDEGGLDHPHWQDNLSFLLKLQALVNRSYPELLRDPSLRQERFNTHETSASLILEVGSNGNTLPEALAAVKYLAPAIAALLRAQQGS